MAEVVIIGGLLAGGYLLLKKNQQGVTPSSVTPTKGTFQSGPVPPHLIVNAKLLSDLEIAQMEADTVLHFKNAPGDKQRFINTTVTDHLPNEKLKPIPQCSQGGNYQGPPLAIQVTKEGQFALNSVSSIGSAAGGGFGSANGLFGSGFAEAGTTLGKAIPIVGTVIGIGLSIFGAISKHHADAVRNEQGLECSLVPPANQALALIEQAVMNGTWTIQQAQTALDTLYSDFRKEAKNGQSGQLEETANKLNAMGWYAHFLHAIILKKKNRYANLAA